MQATRDTQNRQRRSQDSTALLKADVGICLKLIDAVVAYTGRIIGLTDGNTNKVMCDRTKVNVDNAKIDAIERWQPFGAEAIDHRSQLV